MENDEISEKFEKYLDEDNLLLAMDYADRYYDLIQDELGRPDFKDVCRPTEVGPH